MRAARCEARKKVTEWPKAAAHLECSCRLHTKGQEAHEERRRYEAVPLEVRARGPLATTLPDDHAAVPTGELKATGEVVDLEVSAPRALPQASRHVTWEAVNAWWGS